MDPAQVGLAEAAPLYTMWKGFDAKKGDRTLSASFSGALLGEKL